MSYKALSLLIVALLISGCCCVSNARFDKYIDLFGKKYKDINEYTYRLKIFNFNLQQIAEHNANPDITYDLGQSYYTDIEDDEFVRTVLSDGGRYLAEYAKVPLTTGGIFTGYAPVVPVPKNVNELNWDKKKLVSGVKNQGVCGNGYAFGAVAAAESALMIQAPILKVSYSEQQVTDCCRSVSGYSCNGCAGGSLIAVFDYIAQAGISTCSDYPYTSESGRVGTCVNVSGMDKIASAKSYLRIPPQNLSALYNELSKRPVAVLVDASNWGEYKGGVFRNCSESMTSNNHAALLVGYDEKGNWLVKNSWGDKWGESGYITLASGNTCGISNYAITFNVDSIM